MFCLIFRRRDYRFYDAIGRIQEAVYADSSRSYAYDYDVAGNRLQEQVMIDNTGTPVVTTTNWTYNNANQIATMQVGSNPVSNFQYDANGNLTSDGQMAYTWDRANRLTTLNNGSYNTHYAYDGNSNRVQQKIGGIATDYLLDIQPQLALVLKETTPSETLSYVHSPKGVHAVEDNTGDWHFMVNDGLGSVRSQVDELAQVEASQVYSPYGQVYGVEGTFTGSFGYTGEQVDESGMSYLRARYYDPSQATFASLDPFEGKSCTPMSLNGYAYVHGNPILNTDPSGMMVAGRSVNIDTSGTSRILQSWSNALKGAFTIPSLSLVKSMNSGMCDGASGRGGNVSKPDGRFYSQGGGSDIRQDGIPATPTTIIATPTGENNSLSGTFIPYIIPEGYSIPSDMFDEYHRLCQELCNDDHADNIHSQVPRNCREGARNTCHDLCNYEPRALNEDYDHNGVLVRWIHYWIDLFNLRDTHKYAYEEVMQPRLRQRMDNFDTGWNSALNSNCRESQPEFDIIAQKWRSEELAVPSEFSLEPEFNTPIPECNTTALQYIGAGFFLIIAGGLVVLSPGAPDELVPVFGAAAIAPCLINF